jgi:thiamine-monophosphate kinase
VLEGTLAVDDGDSLLARYRLPMPRTTLGPRLVGLATAMIDVSDGLVADLGHVAAASEVGATVGVGALPLSPTGQVLVAVDPVHLVTAITGGDDYELLFTAPAGREREVAALAEELDIAVTAIGEIEREPGIRVVDVDGRPIAVGAGGYRHF